MRAALALALALALCSGSAALAEQSYPDLSYFTGVYERVGRDAGTPPALINDLLRITPAADGKGLTVRSCDPLAHEGWPLELRPGEFDEVPNILEGKDGPFGFWCQFFNDHSNYPVLTCASQMGARFTLWAITDDRAADCSAGLP
ncbi:hypothetical protein MASR1M32_28470 [Rhodobacter sp.]